MISGNASSGRMIAVYHRPCSATMIAEASFRAAISASISLAAVTLQTAASAFEMGGRALRLTVGPVEVHRRRWIGAAPGSIVARVDPQSARLCATAARVEH